MKRKISPRAIRWVISDNNGFEVCRWGNLDPKRVLQKALSKIYLNYHILFLEDQCTTRSGFRPIYTYILIIGTSKTYKYYVYDSKDYSGIL